MSSSSLDTLLKLSKTTSPQKLFAYDCVRPYVNSGKDLKLNILVSAESRRILLGQCVV